MQGFSRDKCGLSGTNAPLTLVSVYAFGCGFKQKNYINKYAAVEGFCRSQGLAVAKKITLGALVNSAIYAGRERYPSALLDLQTETTAYCPGWLQSMIHYSNELNGELPRFIEAAILAIYDYKRAQNATDRLLAWVRFLAHVQGKTVASTYASAVTVLAASAWDSFSSLAAAELSMHMQSLDITSAQRTAKTSTKLSSYEEQVNWDTVGSAVDKFESMYDNVGRFWKTTASQTIRSMWVVVVAMLVSNEEGIKVTKEQIERLRTACKSQEWYFSEDNPIEFLVRSTLFILRLVVACGRAGDIFPLFGEESGTLKWILDSQSIISLGNNLSILECFGTDVHKFTRDLEATISAGEILTRVTAGVQQREIVSMLGKLKLVKNDALARKLASETREPPFAVLFHGGTSVGKTSLVDIFHTYFAGLRNLDPDVKFRYSRNSAEDHWNNFTTAHWCILFDEIAPLKPNMASEVDPMTRELLGVCNSAPYNPNQASLEDKGKTPCLAKLVIGTTNVLDLNTPIFFESPTAVMRRFHMIVDVKVKTEYAKTGTTMLDYSKTDSGKFPDFWEFRILKAQPKESVVLGPRIKQELEWVVVYECKTITEFLTYVCKANDAHVRECEVLKSSRSLVLNFGVCGDCRMPDKLCTCLTTVNEVESPDMSDTSMSDHLTTEGCENDDCDVLELQTNTFGGERPEMPAEWLNYADYVIMTWRESFRRFGIRRTFGYALRQFKFRLFGMLVGMCVFGKVEHFVASCFDRTHYLFVVSQNAISNQLQSPRLRKLVKALLVGGGIAISAYALSVGLQRYRLETKGDDQVTVGMDAQTLNERLKSSPINQPVVWYKDDMQTTRFDVGPRTTSWKGATRDWMIEKLHRNVAQVVNKMNYLPDEAHENPYFVSTYGTAICLGSHLWVTNAHFFPGLTSGVDTWTISFNFGGGPGVSSDVRELTVRRSNLVYYTEDDLAFMWLPTITPRADLTGLLPLRSLRGVHSGFTVRRVGVDKPNFETTRFMNCRWGTAEIARTGTTMLGWSGQTEDETRVGQCGGLAISMSYFGPIILGIHSVGRGNNVLYTPIFRDVYDAVVAKFTHAPISSASIMLPKGSPVIAPVTHVKSPLRYIPEGSVEAVGTVIGSRADPKTKLKDSPLRKYLETRGWACKYGAPAMKGWEPKYNALKDVLSPHTKFDLEKLTLAAHQVADFIMEKLPEGWQSELGVVDIDTAVNGLPGVAHMDRINISTSSGFPYGGPKKRFLSDPNGDFTGRLEVDEVILEQVHEILDAWKTSQLAGVVITAALKDEPRKFDKIEAKLTRMFQVAPMGFTIAMRTLLMSFLRLFYNSHEAFCSAPGMDATSGEWDQLAQWISELENVIDGDFRKFDTILKGDIMQAVALVIYRIMSASGAYSAGELTQVQASIMECTYIFVNFFGDLMRLFGVNSSGNAATVLFNCLANFIIMVYVFNDLKPREEMRFIDCVRAMFYGDDNLLSTREDWFNFTAIRSHLATLNVEYTPANKEDGDYVFKRIEQCEFLKRTFRYDDLIGHYVAPLNQSSIEKMVMVMIPSATVDEGTQVISSITSAVMEAFLHGPDFHARVVEDLRGAVHSAGLMLYEVQGTYPSYDYLLEKYKEKCKTRDFFRASQRPLRYKRDPCPSDGVEALSQELNQTVTLSHSYCAPSFGSEGVSVDELVSEPGRSPNTLFSVASGTDANHPEPGGTIGSRVDQLKNQPANQYYEYQTEEVETSHVVAETTQFASETEGDSAGFNAMPRVASAMERVELGKFLGRPVQIYYTLWTPGSGTGSMASLRPWHIFLTNLYMANKLSNYAFIRGNLKIKVLVNATPFVYGAALVSYWPLSGINRDKTNPAYPNYIVTRSQRPHIWIDPSQSKGGELTLPFFYQRDWLELGEAEAARAMGTLNVDIVQALQTATTSANVDCSIQIYAWMENVELSGPTVGYIQQTDEFKGPISGPASAVAAIARSAAKVPVIGRVATAAEVGATALAKMSSLFGFSNVVDLNGASKVQPSGFPDMATVGTSHPISKLTLDPKNGLGISNANLGCPEENPLIIKDLVTRDSYVGAFTWTPTQTTDTLLFCGRVTPKVYTRDAYSAVSGTNIIHMTPMCMVSRLFRYWRGDIILTFKFVATPYHKGRVIISYDPTGGSTSNLANTTDTTAVVQTYIVDMSTLGPDKTFEVRLPYSQAAPWLGIPPRMDAGKVWANFSSPAYVHDAELDNGNVSVRVQTELSSPSGTGTVPVMVFARGADNLEFAGPGIDQGQVLTYMEPQTDEVEGMASTAPPKELYLLNMGEKVEDLRTVIQRRSKSLNIRVVLTDISKYQSSITVLGRTPIFPGHDRNGFHSVKSTDGTATIKGNIVHWSPLTWLWPNFVGNRGSVDYVVNGDLNPLVGHLSVARGSGENTPALESYTELLGTASSSELASWLLPFQGGTGGLAVTNQNVLPTISASFPMYHYNKFCSSEPGLGTSASIDATTWPTDNYTGVHQDRKYDSLHITVIKNTGTVTVGRLETYVSAGLDFSFVWFIGAQPVWDTPALVPV